MITGESKKLQRDEGEKPCCQSSQRRLWWRMENLPRCQQSPASWRDLVPGPAEEHQRPSASPGTLRRELCSPANRERRQIAVYATIRWNFREFGGSSGCSHSRKG
ncbi:unnamed protein product [Tetraodon nigroviridis]|uniref:(spotted green pufferfish) hypothetical protein n=1 Tax=Tetraodon nigroviridis TaxID=99883 RepID=Q4SSQ7_TETNG|nr:unnamed protein product [Tetraodon nigroviridis]